MAASGAGRPWFDIHVLLFSHVQGLAVHLEPEAQAEAATGQSEDQWMDSRAHTFLAESTVKTHVTRILAKTGSRDRIQAVILAYDTRLVNPR